MRRDHEAIFVDILTSGMDCPVAKARLLTRLLLSGATGVAGWFRPDGQFSAEEIAAVYSDTLLNGLLRH